ncbi:putative phage baseplate assembly protein [Paracoccus pantotrophus]|uniref:Phage baseplate assembly protein n=1 Tax=Paracoccus pantotrophus TaxID=82367 RepID=A0AAE6NWX5_PARPN|nr:hypothetical protein [Paracoccus pantotrophus]QFG36303.1 hypothetical protein ESD82_08790 [Paracoccus pantotrophus]RKS43115.1 putative phage baseplate assembly protein [Paracoccus pantotrophus]
MSRPPIHRPSPSPRGTDRYFGPDFNELVALAETLARDGHGIEIPAKGRGLARTLIELPALVAHILGEHQGLYAREASLGSARLAENLTRHARKLAYSPGPGAAATGLAAFTVKPGLSGSLPQGFALQTSPLGEARAQTFETLAEAQVDAQWNAIRPAEAEIPDPVQAMDGQLTLLLERRHGLSKDEIVLLEGARGTGVFRVADAMEGSRPPQIALRHIGGHPFAEPGTGADWQAGYRLLARPRHDARLFGWNAPAALWPAEALAAAKPYVGPSTTQPTGTTAFGYAAPAAPGDALLLAETLKQAPAPGDRAVLLFPDRAEVYWLETLAETAVTFLRGEVIEQPKVTSSTDAAGATAVSVTTEKTVAETALSGRATTLGLAMLSPGRPPRSWTDFPLDAHVLTGWAEMPGLLPAIPNPAPLQPEFAVAADLSAMRPGRPAILRRISTGEAREASFAAIKPPPAAGGGWTLQIEVPGGFPADWPMGDVEVLGNVVRVSHGEAKQDILGGSDGVTPHQEFALKNAPVTRLPGALGSRMALEVRVDGVLWDLVPDFHDAGPDDRVHLAQTDAAGEVRIRFGGEGRGAIPPSGRRNVTAAYRTGLGAAGNTGAGRLSRIRKASPLIGAVTNPLPIAGGADPAGAEDIARQAVRPVRVFDRAVSIEDHADLALLFPGISRASARWRDGVGIELVAADAEGNGPADLAGFTAFLDARRDTGQALVVAAPQAVDIALALRIERDRAWLAEAARHEAEALLLGGGDLPGLFSFAGRELSAPQSLSGLYARLLERPGIAAVLATRYRLAQPAAGTAEVADIIHASTRQWLRLKPSALEIQVLEPGALGRLQQGGAP